MSMILQRASRALPRGYRHYSVKFPQSVEELQPQKPKVGQFKTPLFHTFLIASSTYMFLHMVGLALEHEEEQKLYIQAEKELETEIQTLVDQKKLQLQLRRWYHFFWKSS